MAEEAIFDLDQLLEDGILDISSDLVESQVDSAFGFCSDPVEVLFDNGDSDAFEGLVQAASDTASPGNTVVGVSDGTGRSGHFDGSRFVPDCERCGAWQPYDGHCICDLVGSFDDDSHCPRLDSFPIGNVVFVFGGDPPAFDRPRPVYPYSDGFCWLLAFHEDDREHLLDNVDVSPEASISTITKLGHFYRYSDQKLDIVTIQSRKKYHFVPAEPTSRTARTFVEWRETIYEVNGAYSNAKYGVFAGYTPWDPRGDAATAARGQWMNVQKFSTAVKLSFSSPFSKQIHRNAILEALQDVVPDDSIVGVSVRFPADGVYAIATSPTVSTYLSQMRLAAEYKDRSKDELAKRGVEESGVTREQGYGDTLASFANAMASLLVSLTTGVDVHTRESFERRYGLKWDGDDDSVRSPWSTFSSSVAAVSSLPWFSDATVFSLCSQLNRVNPSLQAHLQNVSASVYNAFIQRPGFEKGRRFDHQGQAGLLPMTAGDWPRKFASLFMVAGYADGTKDEKFKLGQKIPESKRDDKNDMMVQFENTRKRVVEQYARYDGFLTSEEDVTKYYGIAPKRQQQPPGKSGASVSVPPSSSFSDHEVIDF